MTNYRKTSFWYDILPYMMDENNFMQLMLTIGNFHGRKKTACKSFAAGGYSIMNPGGENEESSYWFSGSAIV
jgi:hypothetical protein